MYLIREWFAFIGELLEISPFLLPTHVNNVAPNNNNNNGDNNGDNNNNGPQLQNIGALPRPSFFALRVSVVIIYIRALVDCSRTYRQFIKFR